MSYLKIKSLISGVILVMAGLGISSLAQAEEATSAPCNETYIVKKGDTLTGILAEKIESLHSDKRIYGSDGLLRATLRLNADKIKSADLIFPNQKLLLPEEISSECKKAEAPVAEAPLEKKVETNSPTVEATPAAPDANANASAPMVQPTEAVPAQQPAEAAPPAQEPAKAPEAPQAAPAQNTESAEVNEAPSM